jgi:NADPH-dependent curcumin reductase CurA
LAAFAQDHLGRPAADVDHQPLGLRRLQVRHAGVDQPRFLAARDHFDRQAQFYNDMGLWMSAGKIKWQETIVTGIENAPKAFIGLFQGDNVGKMLVKL